MGLHRCVTLSLIVLVIMVAQAHAEEFTALSAKSPEGVYSVRKVAVTDKGEHYIGVFGSKPFIIKLDSSYPQAIQQATLFVSTGEALDFTTGEVPYECKYLMPYWTIAIVKYEDGHVETCQSVLRPAWKKEDQWQILDDGPGAVRPQSDIPQCDAILSQWWESTVEPAAKEFFQSHDNAAGSR